MKWRASGKAILAFSVAIAALYAAACRGPAGAPQATGALATPVSFSPYTSSSVWRFVGPAVQLVTDRLQATRDRLPSNFRIAYRGCYGSTFLIGNDVGNDLDYIVGVHVGTIRGDASRPDDIAEQIVVRAESFLEALRATLQAMASRELVPLAYPFEFPQGRFARHQEIFNRLAASLRDVAAGKQHPVLVESDRYAGVPASLSPDETYLDETLLVDMVTPCFRSSAGMFPGLRRIQLVVHFLADLELADGTRVVRRPNFRIEPVHRKSGALLATDEYLLGYLPLDAASAEAFKGLAVADRDHAADGRVEQALGLVLETRRRLIAGDPLKAVKRFQQGFEMVAPALDKSLAQRVYAVAREAYHDRDLLAAVQLEEMATVLGAVLRIRQATETYQNTGDVPRVLAQMDRDLNSLMHRSDIVPPTDVAAMRASLRQAEALAFGAGAVATQAVLLLDRLVDQSKKWQAKLYTPAAKIEPILNSIENVIRGAGFVTLPVRGMPDGTLAVLAADFPFAATAGKDVTQDLAALGAPPFTYHVVDEAALRPDPSAPLRPPSKVLVLRAGRTPGQEQAYQMLHRALLADLERFGAPRSSSFPRPDPAVRVPGRPQDSGRAAPIERTLFWRNASAQAVRSGDLKLVVDGQSNFIFNVREDLGERNDLTNVSQNDARRLRSLLDAWAADVDAEKNVRVPEPAKR
jgi:hypothetical protein